jgi:hypothetical protein
MEDVPASTRSMSMKVAASAMAALHSGVATVLSASSRLSNQTSPTPRKGGSVRLRALSVQWFCT